MDNNNFLEEMKNILLDKDNYAKKFAEGNIDLENALLSLWDKGYCTTACCAGHETVETESYIYNNDPAIVVYYENDVEKEISLISSLDKNNIKSIDIFSEHNCITFTGIKDNKSLFFKDFSKDYDKFDDNYKLLMEFSLNNDLDVDISYNNGEIEKIMITTTNQDVANLLKDYAECNEYEYDNKDYYYFNLKDFSFLDKLIKSNKM